MLGETIFVAIRLFDHYVAHRYKNGREIKVNG